MIVNPQLFNYRLIISSLVVILTVLGVFTYVNYENSQSHQLLLKQEKTLIENELSELFASYNELTEDYKLLSAQLQNAELRAELGSDSLLKLQSDLFVINTFNNQLQALEAKNKELINAIDSLSYYGAKPKSSKPNIQNSVNSKTLVIQKLEKVNDSLSRIIKKGSILKANKITVRTFELNSGKKEFTDLAKRAKSFQVCVTLAENALTAKGKKNIYIQIVSPTGNVISDRGEVTFGEDSLIYSKKEVINYWNESLEFCTEIMPENQNQFLSKGYYFINVFNDNSRLGSTSIKLI